MNYVSHHLVARREKPDALPWFYAGNLLPDLLPSSGDGRVRHGDVETLPDGANLAALTNGARLHLETDRQFHGLPASKDACANVSEQFRKADWQTRPTRVFFLAHALVEIALGGWIVQTSPDTAHDLYRQLSAVGAAPFANSASTLLGRPTPYFAAYLHRFLSSRYLFSYATFDGQATALRNVCRRAGIPNFEEPEDFARLVQVVSNVAADIASVAPVLLNVGSVVVK